MMKLLSVRNATLLLIFAVVCGLSAKAYLWNKSISEMSQRMQSDQGRANEAIVIDECKGIYKKKLPDATLVFHNLKETHANDYDYEVTGKVTAVDKNGKVTELNVECGITRF
jgi:hypothetical protein